MGARGAGVIGGKLTLTKHGGNALGLREGRTLGGQHRLETWVHAELDIYGQTSRLHWNILYHRL